MRSSKNGVMASLIWKFGERIAAQLVSTVVSIILARILCPEDYGIISIVTILITLCNALVVGGLGNSLIQKRNADNTDYSTVFWSSLVMSLVLYVVMFVLAQPIALIYKSNQLAMVIKIMSLRIPLAAANSVQHAHISKNMQFRKFFYSTLIGTVVSAVVGIVMALNGFGVWALVGQYLTNAAINTVVLFAIGWKPKLLFSFSRLKALLPFGVRMMGVTLLDSFFNEIRGIVISKKFSPTDLAMYDNGKKYPNLIVTNVNTAIGSVIFPVMSSKQDDRSQIKQLMRKAIRTTVFIMSPLLCGFMAVSERFVTVVLTEKWIGCVPFIYITAIMCLFYPIHTINTQALNAIGKSGKTLKLEIVKKTINIAVLLISIPFGVIGIAVGSMIVSLISTYINAFYSKREFNYSFFAQCKDMSCSLVSSVIMFISVFAFDNLVPVNDILLLILDVVLGVAIYVTLAVILRNPEFKMLWSKVKRIFNHRKGQA